MFCPRCLRRCNFTSLICRAASHPNPNRPDLTQWTQWLCLNPGAAYCQLMDLLFPGSLDLPRVRFQSNDQVDSIHNYSLIQAAFRKVGVVRVSFSKYKSGDQYCSEEYWGRLCSMFIIKQNNHLCIITLFCVTFHYVRGHSFQVQTCEGCLCSPRSLQYVPIKALMKRNSTVALTFLQWFKLFFDENNKGREYHALEARGGQSMGPADSGGSSGSPEINTVAVITTTHRSLICCPVFRWCPLSVFFFLLQMMFPQRLLIRNWRSFWRWKENKWKNPETIQTGLQK